MKFGKLQEKDVTERQFDNIEKILETVMKKCLG